jgi:hypothetical protein
MEGAAPRLKRFKQRGWETVVDRLALTDSEIKARYFETLHVERSELQTAVVAGLSQRTISGMVGIAGRCLQKEHLPLLLAEEMISRVMASVEPWQLPRDAEQEWTFLGKRDGAKELVILSRGENWLEEGDVLKGQSEGGVRDSELLISKVTQRQLVDCEGELHTVARVRVNWRYRPDREIPVRWKQNSTFSAGSSLSHG